MLKIICGNRTKNPVYMDLTGLFPKTDIKLGFFRVGDRAAAHVMCLEWRKNNPDHKLVVVDLPNGTNDSLKILVGQECPAEWAFGSIADEIWLLDRHDEPVVLPTKSIMDFPIWEWWYHFEKREGYKFIKPTIKPPLDSLIRVERLKEEWKLPAKYATVQPLFDAPYALYRNKPPEFWENLIESLVEKIPVVVLGHPANYSKMRTHPKAYSGWCRGLSVMDSIAMISGATMHVGGETGTTIWASLMGVNVYGIYALVHYEEINWCADPLQFGGFVRISKGVVDEKKIIADVEECWNKIAE